MSDDELPLFEHPGITIDFETATILQAIEDAGDDVGALVEIAALHPDRFDTDMLAAYAKATGKQNDPQVKALMQALKERIGGPTP